MIIFNGRLLYADKKHLYLAKGRNIFYSRDFGQSWELWYSFSSGIGSFLLAWWPLTARLLRKGVHHLFFDNLVAVAVMDKQTFFFEDDRSTVALGMLQGSRPLTLCARNNMFYYGEYRSNPERSPVHVWRLKEGEEKWHPAWRFEGIRHVHGVFHDPYENSIWVTTGDLDHEAGIWRTDDGFEMLEKVAGGSQKFRAVQLLFTEDHVYFGSDAPDDKNYIFRMGREGKNVEELAKVGGSVFYGCKVANHLFFSTAVEPSRVNTTRYAEVWGSADGSNWQVIQRFKKDIWPMKYFQYGQVLFPAGPGDGENLWFTPFAAEFDQKTFKIPLLTLPTHHS